MKEHTVCLRVWAEKYVKVKAETPDDAIQKADESEDNQFSLCNYCSDRFELSDISSQNSIVVDGDDPCKCNYVNQFDHDRDCHNFDFEREFNLLEAKVNILETLATEDFKISMGFNGAVYFIGLKHPDQDEEFTGDTLEDALTELRGWFNDCQEMM